VTGRSCRSAPLASAVAAAPRAARSATAVRRPRSAAAGNQTKRRQRAGKHQNVS
jgi:hypothetical protein